MAGLPKTSWQAEGAEALDTCRDISALVSRAMDSRLPLGERLRVRLHLAICQACRRFARQVQLLRSATRHLRHRIENGDMPDFR